MHHLSINDLVVFILVVRRLDYSRAVRLECLFNSAINPVNDAVLHLSSPPQLQLVSSGFPSQTSQNRRLYLGRQRNAAGCQAKSIRRGPCVIEQCKLHSLKPADFVLIFAPRHCFVRELCANMRNLTVEFRSNFKVEVRGRSS